MESNATGKAIEERCSKCGGKRTKLYHPNDNLMRRERIVCTIGCRHKWVEVWRGRWEFEMVLVDEK